MNKCYGRPCKTGEYNDATHAYYDLDKKKHVPSVTEICQPSVPETDAVVAGSERGSIVHAMFSDTMLCYPRQSYGIQYSGYQDGIEDWKEQCIPSETKNRVITVEEPWISPAGFGGTIDLGIKSINVTSEILPAIDTESIFDVKTSKPNKWHGKQLAGYALIYCHKPYEARRTALYLTADGKWYMKEYTDIQDFIEFAKDSKEIGVIF